MPANPAIKPLTLAFFDIPWPARLATTLPLARALAERGHRVVAFTLAPLRPLIEAAGVEAALQPDFGPEPPDCTVNLRTIDYATHALPAIIDALRALAPDAVVFTAKCLWAALAADHLGLPTIGVHTNALWPRDLPLPERVRAAGWIYADRSPAEVDALVRRDRAAWADCAARHGAHRIEPVDVVPDLPNAMNLRGELNLVYTSEALQPHRAAFGPDTHFIGPCYDDRPGERDPDFEAAIDRLPRPLIYAALGSMPAYNDRPALLGALCATLRAGGRGAVMAVGSDRAVDALGDPGPAACVRAVVPQLAVLDRAALFISHAGTNSACEALLAGVPLLMLPQAADQFIVAWHLENLGLGRWFDAPLDQLGPAIDALLADTGLHARVRAAGDDLRRAGGAPRAVALIEAHLTRPRTIP